MQNETTETETSDAVSGRDEPVVMCEKQKIRMTLYKDVYLQYLPEIRQYGGNIARDRAEQALYCFDSAFE